MYIYLVYSRCLNINFFLIFFVYYVFFVFLFDFNLIVNDIYMLRKYLLGKIGFYWIKEFRFLYKFWWIEKNNREGDIF